MATPTRPSAAPPLYLLIRRDAARGYMGHYGSQHNYLTISVWCMLTGLPSPGVYVFMLRRSDHPAQTLEELCFDPDSD